MTINSAALANIYSQRINDLEKQLASELALSDELAYCIEYFFHEYEESDKCRPCRALSKWKQARSK